MKEPPVTASRIIPASLAMPDEPRFSKAAEELIGDFRGIAFTEPRKMRRRPTKPHGAAD